MGGGIAGAAGFKKEKENTTSQIDEKTPLYKNTKGNVKNTLIDFLNSEYNFDYNGNKISFSQMYKQKNNIPIENSPEMKELLFKVQIANGGEDINNISKWESFKAPNLKSMFNEFFKTQPTESIKTTEQPKQKPTNTSKLSKRDNNLEEISKLMKTMKG
jgi:transcriptional/translational regulatory protein YebC/TACO1